MAMLIGKFHRLIQSRLLWLGFLLVVVFTFVIWGMITPRGARRAREQQAAGRLNGKPVSHQEFRQAYFNSYLSVVMIMGQALNITPKLDKELRRAAWRRLAALAEARKLGISASDAEVVATIQHHPGFAVDGRFSPARYNAFIAGLLRSVGVSETQFEQHVREEIILQKMRHMIRRAALISPFEQKRAFATLTDVFTVDYTLVRPSDVAGEVHLSREDVRAYFDRDPAAFTIPEKVRVAYVEFPISNYLADASVSEDDIQAYYDQHIDDFTTDTNAAATNAASSTNAVAETDSLYRPLDEVHDEIAATLRHNAAVAAAQDAATDFVVALAPDREGNAPTFEEAAADRGLKVLTLPPFAEKEPLAGISAGLDFNHAAFELSLGPDDYFSDAVVGTSAVYVIALKERFEPRVPQFDEVAARVRAAAEADALEKALTEKARKLHDDLEKGLAAGKTFAKIVRRHGLIPVNVTNLTAAVGFKDLDEDTSDTILRAILVRNQGELTDLVPLEDAIAIAYIAERKPGDPARFESLRQNIINALRRDRARLLWQGFEDYLLRQAHFEEKTYPEETAAETNLEEDIAAELPAAEEGEAASTGAPPADLPRTVPQDE